MGLGDLILADGSVPRAWSLLASIPLSAVQTVLQEDCH